MSNRHRTLRGYLRAWIIALADPGVRRDVPSERLSVADIKLLSHASMLHAVQPAVFRNLASLVAENGVGCIARNGDAEAALKAAFEEENVRRAAQVRIEAALIEQGDRIVAALTADGMHPIRAKGDVFARRLYPTPLDRPFGDIDILVPADNLDRTKPIMEKLGFRLDLSEMKDGADFRLDKWLFESEKAVEVEIQANLIHSRKFAAVGLSYDELLFAGDGNPEDATALLIVGAVHGAAVHQFDRLQHVFDVFQAVRGTAGRIDADRLKKVARKIGATVAVQTALDLVATIYGDTQSRDLADQLSPAPLRGIRNQLLTADVVMRARSKSKRRDSWRRRLLRMIIINNAKSERRRANTA